jgi:hypothetical protein
VSEPAGAEHRKDEVLDAFSRRQDCVFRALDLATDGFA